MKKTVSGNWYDGQSSNAIPTRFGVDDTRLLFVDTEAGRVAVAYDQVRISDRLGNSPRRVEFPGGGAFETKDNDGIDQIIGELRPNARPWLHRFETNWPLMAGAVVVLIAVGWVTFQYGIPSASRGIASVVSPKILTSIGEQTFAGINRFGLEPSGIDPPKREQISAEFQRMVGRAKLDGQDCRIEFRSARKTFGPNAFAIPPCLILVTDELVDVAQHDDEIYAVLAHELGHIKHRHALRRIVQDTFLTFIFMMMTGDTTQVSVAIASIPAVLLEFGYARDFEREADGFALAYMQDHQIPLHRFPDILESMQAWTIEKACEQDKDCLREVAEYGGEPFLDYLSTHPSTTERAEMFARGN